MKPITKPQERLPIEASSSSAPKPTVETPRGETGPDQAFPQPRAGQRQKQSHVSAKELHEKLRQLFSAKMFSAEACWDGLALHAGWFHFLHPLKDDVQSLAKKYGGRPGTFERKLSVLFKKRMGQLAKDPNGRNILTLIANYLPRVFKDYAAPASGHDDEALLRSLPNKKRVALLRLVPFFDSALNGRPAELSAEELRDFVREMSARDAGRPKDSAYDQALVIYNSGKYKKRVWHRLCLDVIPNYQNLPSSLRAEHCRKMRAAITCRQKTSRKSPS